MILMSNVDLGAPFRSLPLEVPGSSGDYTTFLDRSILVLSQEEPPRRSISSRTMSPPIFRVAFHCPFVPQRGGEIHIDVER